MSIVVPIHDAPSVTHRCLASLERYAARAEIILVDDGSKLPDTDRIIREFRAHNGWKVISNTKACGHSAACAAGAALATRPYLCLLNSDTVVTPWCWHAIYKAFETYPVIGVAGPCTSNSWNEQTLDVAEKCRFYWNDSQICAFAQRLAVKPPDPEIVDLPWIGGFAFFIRRSLWEQLEGFDPNLADYGNESELCKRVANLKYRTVWVRSGYIHHVGRQSYPARIGRKEVLSRIGQSVQYIYDKHNWRPGGAPSTRATRADKKW